MQAFKLFLLLISIIYSCENTAKSSLNENNRREIIINKAPDTSFNYRNTLIKLSKIVDTTNIKKYNNEITHFLIDDSTQKTEAGKILFIGSSSIRKWKTISEDLNPYPIINRGFGGSTIPEVIFYSEKIIFPYKPPKIFFYAGDNDIAWNHYSPQIVIQTFILFAEMIKYYLPETSIYFISIKPSPAREQYTEKFREANKLIKSYTDTCQNIKYIDVFSKMLTPEGNIKEDIFIKDKLHLNEKGYNIWKKEIYKYL